MLSYGDIDVIMYLSTIQMNIEFSAFSNENVQTYITILNLV